MRDNIAKVLAKKSIKILFSFSIATMLLFFSFFVVISSIIAESFEEKAMAISLEKEDETSEDSTSIYDENFGKATYAGVDDTDTPFSRNILKRLSRYSNSYSPYTNGYRGYCEKFCQDIYRGSGHKYNGSCCAYTHGKNYAKTEGKIPKGAVIFSGRKPDGTYYQNGGRRSAFCRTCNNFAGHVAIYIGNGKVAGSQVPYIMSLDHFITVYGYGGYSLE